MNPAFCSGDDVAEIMAGPKAASSAPRSREPRPTPAAMAALECTKPVIAAVKGYCMGGGFELVLQCDISIVADNAIFSLPEVTHGFFPGGGACQRLPRLVGYQKAKELILTGRRFDAQEAKALGIVNQIVPADRVMAVGDSLRTDIAGAASVDVAACWVLGGLHGEALAGDTSRARAAVHQAGLDPLAAIAGFAW